MDYTVYYKKRIDALKVDKAHLDEHLQSCDDPREIDRLRKLKWQISRDLENYLIAVNK